MSGLKLYYQLATPITIPIKTTSQELEDITIYNGGTTITITDTTESPYYQVNPKIIIDDNIIKILQLRQQLYNYSQVIPVRDINGDGFDDTSYTAGYNQGYSAALIENPRKIDLNEDGYDDSSYTAGYTAGSNGQTTNVINDFNCRNGIGDYGFNTLIFTKCIPVNDGSVIGDLPSVSNYKIIYSLSGNETILKTLSASIFNSVMYYEISYSEFEMPEEAKAGSGNIFVCAVDSSNNTIMFTDSLVYQPKTYFDNNADNYDDSSYTAGYTAGSNGQTTIVINDFNCRNGIGDYGFNTLIFTKCIPVNDGSVIGDLPSVSNYKIIYSLSGNETILNTLSASIFNSVMYYEISYSEFEMPEEAKAGSGIIFVRAVDSSNNTIMSTDSLVYQPKTYVDNNADNYDDTSYSVGYTAGGNGQTTTVINDFNCRNGIGDYGFNTLIFTKCIPVNDGSVIGNLPSVSNYKIIYSLSGNETILKTLSASIFNSVMYYEISYSEFEMPEEAKAGSGNIFVCAVDSSNNTIMFTDSLVYQPKTYVDNNADNYDDTSYSVGVNSVTNGSDAEVSTFITKTLGAVTGSALYVGSNISIAGISLLTILGVLILGFIVIFIFKAVKGG